MAVAHLVISGDYSSQRNLDFSNLAAALNLLQGPISPRWKAQHLLDRSTAYIAGASALGGVPFFGTVYPTAHSTGQTGVFAIVTIAFSIT